jgi:pSer/pThr/pTyr-binding forkhead associated (FHA) protein
MIGTTAEQNARVLSDRGRTETLDVGVEASPRGAEVAESLRVARATITAPGCYLIYEDFDGEPIVCALESDTVRVGRSVHADIRFEDPTVSRRHALIVRRGNEVRVVDDRSLNGVFLGGERVLSSLLLDGDEVAVGRHRILFAHLA